MAADRRPSATRSASASARWCLLAGVVALAQLGCARAEPTFHYDLRTLSCEGLKVPDEYIGHIQTAEDPSEVIAYASMHVTTETSYHRKLPDVAKSSDSPVFGEDGSQLRMELSGTVATELAVRVDTLARGNRQLRLLGWARVALPTAEELLAGTPSGELAGILGPGGAVATLPLSRSDGIDTNNAVCTVRAAVQIIDCAALRAGPCEESEEGLSTAAAVGVSVGVVSVVALTVAVVAQLTGATTKPAYAASSMRNLLRVSPG